MTCQGDYTISEEVLSKIEEKETKNLPELVKILFDNLIVLER